MNILINRSDAIGDLLLTLPVLKSLKEAYPNCKIGVLISPRTFELIKLFPDLVDNSWVIEKKNSFLSKYKKINNIIEDFRPTHYFYIGGDTTANLVSKIKGIKFRGGLISKATTFLTLNHGIRQVRSRADFHESEYNLQLLKPLGREFSCDNSISPSLLDSVLIDDFKLELKNCGFDSNKKWIFIHPGMSGHTLNWPLQSYVELVKKLNETMKDLLFILSHTPSDINYINGFNELLPDDHSLPLFYFDGSKKGLAHYIKVLSEASLFIGPSTGNTHLANLVRVKQIGFYSPIKVQSAKRWGPLNQDNRVQIMDPMVECPEFKKCAGESCSYYNCMTTIAIDQAVDIAHKFLIETDGDK